MNIENSGGQSNQLGGRDIVNDRRVSVDVRIEEPSVRIGTMSGGELHIHVTVGGAAFNPPGTPSKRGKKKAG